MSDAMDNAGNAAQAVEIGQHVLYVDALSKPRPAILTAVWRHPEYQRLALIPGVNLVVVSDDPSKDDTYGRQIERFTSVVHRANQPSPGWYWCLPSEYDAERDRALRRHNA